MYAFAYQRPNTLKEAQAAFYAGEDASYLAGGQTLIPTLKQRLRQPSVVVDLGAIAALKGITASNGAVSIGAAVCHADVAAAPEIRKLIPALAQLASQIGDPQVRNRGTLGGSIANNDPASDYPAALVGLGATVRTTARDLAADEFFTGMFETALAAGELVVSVSFPALRRAAYLKFRNPASRYAIVGVMVAENARGIRVAVTGAGPVVFRIPEMEAALAKEFSIGAIQNICIAPDALNADIHATAAYRAHLIGVMAERAVAMIA
ncbi:MAG: xanthine dehydrogenase family protein subunit M [Rhodospirillaceae bacterium]|nr:xanthine dehydrogenase family protein subunit M [Rhodospirillaceae bacterium]